FEAAPVGAVVEGDVDAGFGAGVEETGDLGVGADDAGEVVVGDAVVDAGPGGAVVAGDVEGGVVIVEVVAGGGDVGGGLVVGGCRGRRRCLCRGGRAGCRRSWSSRGDRAG